MKSEASSIRLRVLFFGSLRKGRDEDEVSWALPVGATLELLIEEVCRCGRIEAQEIRSLRFAVNREFASRETPLQDGDEIALLPPMSGG